MIVLSLILVIIAAITLLAGFFSEGLTLIWVSIGACVLSIATLAMGVMQRRRSQPELTAPAAGYGPGAVGPKPAPAQLATIGDEGAPDVIAKTSARDAAERRADVEAAGDEAADAVVVKTAARKRAKKATKKTARKATKKTARKATKKTAKKATKKTARKTAKKATRSSGTTGQAAREILGGIQGVGQAKQDILLKKFKSIEAIKAASVEDLAALDGLGPTAARKIKDAL